MASETRLRVAHIITQLELGGAQRNTLYTVAHLDPARYDVALICGPGGILDEEARRTGLPLFFIRNLIRPIRPWKDVLALLALYQTLRQFRPHVVHTHSSKAGILGRIAAYVAGVPAIIHTFHGFGFTPDQSNALRSQLIRVERVCARLSTHLVYVSEENRRQANALGIERNIPSSLIRSGIQMTFPKESGFRQELNIPGNAWVVTTVGNFKPQKNPLDQAKTAITALRQDPDLQFVFVGDGDLRPTFEKWVQGQPYAENIHFVGWRQDVPSILAASNSFLLTSRWEGLPRAVVEAFAAGLPVVAYAVDGVREVIDEAKTGFLISPGDTALAAQQVIWLKAHPQEAAAMGREGQRRIRKEFDIDLMVRQQDELYQKIFNAYR